MNISLVDVDGHNYPNLALMKIASYHKMLGDNVEWYNPLYSKPDKVYASKVFTFTSDYQYFPNNCEIVKGGIGYNFNVLPDEIENMLPDYSMYGIKKDAYGFLTRGCIRNCSWCIVPKKEGTIRIVDDIERISLGGGRKHIILMDNNFLASEEAFVTEQLEKAQRLNLHIDFNQALDVRLVTEQIAKQLAQTKWIKYIRFSCDTDAMLEHVKNAVTLIRMHGYKGKFFIYVLAKKLDSALKRIVNLEKIDKYIVPFCQPYMDFTNKPSVPKDLRRLARWCNYQSVRTTVRFEEYKY